ncbi:hypothetical protein FRC03_007167 [Tulasnella sp. 419]|nr:hypothetical protein FRC03_007167 [Tulasnella sp. 419]
MMRLVRYRSLVTSSKGPLSNRLKLAPISTFVKPGTISSNVGLSTSSPRYTIPGTNTIRRLATSVEANAQSPIPPTLTQTPTSLTIVHPSFPHGSFSFPYIWLRDSCPCPLCIDPSTRQKLHRSSDIPLDIAIESVEPIRTSENKWAIKITWNKGIYKHDTGSTGIEGHKDVEKNEKKHVSEFGLDYLVLHSSPSKLRELHYTDVLEPRPWLTRELERSKDSNLFIPYSDLCSSQETVLRALTQLTQYGLVVLTGVPTQTSSSPGNDWEMRRVANIFSHVRETFYGDLWDVRSIPRDRSKNIAYTDLDLDLHMDILYLESPPRYQLLHCLRNRDVVGGESLFVDALQAAHTLFHEDRAAFDVLRTTDVGFWYMNDGHHLERSHKTIVVEQNSDPLSTKVPRITAINYSPPFQSPLPLSTTSAEFYPALQKFAALLRRPQARWEYLMKEGDVFVFDNRRVLHARKAFFDSGAGDGKYVRWLKGCYVEADAVKDKLRVLRTQLTRDA